MPQRRVTIQYHVTLDNKDFFPGNCIITQTEYADLLASDPNCVIDLGAYTAPAATTGGTSWTNGTGIPDNSVGEDGDFYIDNSTSDVYLKADGAYVFTFNIKGAPGTNGAAGAAGASSPDATTKIYRTILTQAASDDPVATVLKNTLGATPVWTRSGIGLYALTLVAAFPLVKTHCRSIHLDYGSNCYLAQFIWLSADVVEIRTFSTEGVPVELSGRLHFELTIEP